MKRNLKVTKLPREDLSFTNCVYLNPADIRPSKETPIYVSVKGHIYPCRPYPDLPQGYIAMNGLQRIDVYVALDESVSVSPWPQTWETNDFLVNEVVLEVIPHNRSAGPVRLSSQDLRDRFMKEFCSRLVMINQRFFFQFDGNNYIMKVTSLHVNRVESILETSASVTGSYGTITDIARITFVSTYTHIEITGNAVPAKNPIFRPDFNFEAMGIGGLNQEFANIFRRAFVSRIFPSAFIQKLGIKHVRGLLLSGPPGCGKTLMARQIGKMLSGREPKVINGPEILNKYVGESEANIRNIFVDAESDYKHKGDESDLHIIIFDEIDALCRQRGNSNDGTGVRDSIVNQILTKIDGINALNNILVIGMTNRPDMLDEALLRPGRLEIHVEIGLPTEEGRHQILKIHTAAMIQGGCLDSDVDLTRLAHTTENFSGAELEGLVKNAASFALDRHIDPNNLQKEVDTSHIKVTSDDFTLALSEIKPHFGSKKNDLDKHVINGIIEHGSRWTHLTEAISVSIEQVHSTSQTPLVSILLEGPPGSGKTSVSITTALGGKFPYIRRICSDDMVGFSNHHKCQRIQQLFDDAHKSPLGCIILDDIEDIIEYVAVGPIFNNMILQTLLALTRRQPPTGHHLCIIGTTSEPAILNALGLSKVFHRSFTIPLIENQDELLKVVTALEPIINCKEIVLWSNSILLRGYPIKRLINDFFWIKQKAIRLEISLEEALSQLLGK